MTPVICEDDDLPRNSIFAWYRKDGLHPDQPVAEVVAQDADVAWRMVWSNTHLWDMDALVVQEVGDSDGPHHFITIRDDLAPKLPEPGVES